MGRRSDNWGKNYGPIDLLILQASPFCNLDCAYCYLPDRSSKTRITVETAVAAVRRVLEADIVDGGFTIVWHAGEPLAVPVEFYAEVFKRIREVTPPDIVIRHTFQTNATLLNSRWAELIKQNEVRIGVSIDGPPFIHDRQRLTRSGSGTHSAVMKGVEVLRNHLIDFYTITVLSAFSLDYPDDIYDFFAKERFTRVGFNLEESEGVHQNSTLHGTDQHERVKAFFGHFYRRYRQSKPPFSVREFSQIEHLISSGGFRETRSSQQQTPLRVVSVDSSGGFSTFAPELLSMTEQNGQGFIFGNVNQGTLLAALTQPRFLEVERALKSGVELCSRECTYFPVCGGGSPSNKLSESGRLDISETKHCQLRFQALPEAIISTLEVELSPLLL